MFPITNFLPRLNIPLPKILMINLFGEYDSERNNASDGTRVSPGYFVMNGQAIVSFCAISYC